LQGTRRRGQIVCESPAVTGNQPGSNPSRAAGYITDLLKQHRGGGKRPAG